MKGDGPKQAIINAMKSLTQFLTAQEFHNLISNLCIEKELKVNILLMKMVKLMLLYVHTQSLSHN